MVHGIKGAQKRALNKAIYERDGGRCHYCSLPLNWYGNLATPPEDQATLDHKIPRSRGGGHTQDNLVLACLPCNMDRRVTPYERFKASRSQANGAEQ